MTSRGTPHLVLALAVALCTSMLLLAGWASRASAATLTTTYKGGNGQDGVSFDLQVTRPGGVLIRGFDTLLADDGTHDVTVWIRPGTATGGADDPLSWQLAGEATATPTEAGPSGGFIARAPVPIYLEEGTYGIAIIVPDVVWYSNHMDEDPFTVEGDGITFVAGYGIEVNDPLPAPFTEYSPRIWNGTIHFGPDQIAVTAGPLGVTDAVRPTFAYSRGSGEGDEIGPLGYECRITAEGEAAPPYVPCPSPPGTYTAPYPLRDGSYVFEVKTVEGDPRAEVGDSRRFTVATVSAPPAADQRAECDVRRNDLRGAGVRLDRSRRALAAARKRLRAARGAEAAAKRRAQRRVTTAKRALAKARVRVKRARAALPAGC